MIEFRVETSICSYKELLRCRHRSRTMETEERTCWAEGQIGDFLTSSSACFQLQGARSESHWRIHCAVERDMLCPRPHSSLAKRV